MRLYLLFKKNNKDGRNSCFNISIKSRAETKEKIPKDSGENDNQNK
jgi:hypothetical protein